MSEPINLNKARKTRARDEKRKQADMNAVKFGRTKAQIALEEAEAEARVVKLDNHKREP